MPYRTCPDCGSRVYRLGCVNCNEAAYIEAQKDYPREKGDDDGVEYADPRDEREDRLRDW